MTTLLDILNPRIVPLPQNACASGKAMPPAHRTVDDTRGRRGRQCSTVSPIPLKWVTLQAYAASSGYSVGALRQKINRKQFEEGVHYRKAPDGRILLNVAECQNWGIEQ